MSAPGIETARWLAFGLRRKSRCATVRKVVPVCYQAAPRCNISASDGIRTRDLRLALNLATGGRTVNAEPCSNQSRSRVSPLPGPSSDEGAGHRGTDGRMAPKSVDHVAGARFARGSDGPRWPAWLRSQGRGKCHMPGAS